MHSKHRAPTNMEFILRNLYVLFVYLYMTLICENKGNFALISFDEPDFYYINVIRLWILPDNQKTKKNVVYTKLLCACLLSHLIVHCYSRSKYVFLIYEQNVSCTESFLTGLICLLIVEIFQYWRKDTSIEDPMWMLFTVVYLITVSYI